MQVPPEFKTPLEEHAFDTLEDEWLRRVSARPTEVGPFVATARQLAAGEDGDPDHARFLLELLDEHLREGELWQARLDLLRQAGGLLVGDDGDVHAEIVSTLDALYAGREIYEPMCEHLGLHRATHEIDRTWEKVDRIHELMRFDVGTIVAMEGRGVGRVEEANLELGKLRVDFARHGTLNMGFRAAVKMLEPLPPEHILRRKVEEPETLKKMADEDPPALLRIVLESRDGDRTAAEIRKDLEGVVPKSRWSSFWSAARKHPQVVVHGKGRHSYAWAATQDHAHEAVWDAFEAAEPRKQIDLLRREGSRAPELVDRMLETLAEDGRDAAESDPGLAFEIACALERAGATPDDDEPFSPPTLLGGPVRRAEAVLAGVEDRGFRERAYREVRERRDDWRELFLRRLPKEEDPKALNLMLDELEAGGEPPPELDRFLDGLLAQPHRAPAAFVWMAERAGDDTALLVRNPLRLFQQILTTVGRDEFTPYRQRLKNLVAKGGTARRTFPELDEEQARAAKDALYRAGFLEEYEREELERALELQFPSLRRGQAQADVLWAMPASIEAKRAQMDRITREELPANRIAIEEARAMGDLRENFEYKAARQRHEYLTSLATKLERDLRQAKAIDLSAVDTDTVRMGTRVTLQGEDGGERTLTVLGPWESEPERGVISYESELAQKLLGLAVGESVETGAGVETVTAIAVAAGDEGSAGEGGESDGNGEGEGS